jgi:hypothetical protein
MVSLPGEEEDVLHHIPHLEIYPDTEISTDPTSRSRPTSLESTTLSGDRYYIPTTSTAYTVGVVMHGVVVEGGSSRIGRIPEVRRPLIPRYLGSGDIPRCIGYLTHEIYLYLRS